MNDSEIKIVIFLPVYLSANWDQMKTLWHFAIKYHAIVSCEEKDSRQLKPHMPESPWMHSRLCNNNVIMI